MDTVVTQSGPKNKFKGLKLAFLKALGAEFIVYRAESRSGAFYNYAVRRFLRRYGLKSEGDFYSELAEDPDNDDDDADADDGCLTQAEANAQKERFDDLRVVSIHQTEAGYMNACFRARFLATGSTIIFPLEKERRPRSQCPATIMQSPSQPGR